MVKYPKLILAIISLQVLFLSLTMFTAWPEMSLWPYLVNKSWLPYENIAIAHTPFLIILLSLWYSLAGNGVLQLKLFTWAIIGISTLFVYKASGGDKMQKVATISALTYGILNFIFEGNGLWFDLFLAPLALLLYIALSNKHYFSSGVIFAIMLLTKQTAFWFAPVMAYTLFTDKNKMIAIKKTLVAFIATILIFLLLLSIFGIFEEFWTWAIKFGIFILPRSQGQIDYPALRQIVFALLPFLILFFQSKKMLIYWALAGAMGAFPRFEFFHFQPALPFVVLALTEVLKQNKLKSVAMIYLTLISGLFLIVVSKNLNSTTRFADSSTLEFAKYIDSQTKDNSNIFILNDWDNIYAFSNTLPATDPWIPHLSWYMTEDIQKEIVSDLTSVKPKYIIMRPFEEIGLGSFHPATVINYIDINYQKHDTIHGRNILIRK